jgi:hypothetical protein
MIYGETATLRTRPQPNDDRCGTGEDGAHSLNLLISLLDIVLIDANSINPEEVADS